MTERDARDMAALIKAEISKQARRTSTRVKMGKVSQASPVRVLLDGDSTAVPVRVIGSAPNAGSRVAVLVDGTAHYLLGVVSWA